MKKNYFKRIAAALILALAVSVWSVPETVHAYSSIYTNDPNLYPLFDQMIIEMSQTGGYTIPVTDMRTADIVNDKFRLYFLGQLPYRYAISRVKGGFRVSPDAPLAVLQAECANHANAKTIVDAFAVEVKDKSYMEKVDFFTKYLCTYVTYDHTGLNAENAGLALASRSVYTLFATQTAVCEGYAKAFYALCAAAGIQVRYVEGYSGGGGHAWNEVFIPEKNNWFIYDITFTDGGASATMVPVPYNNQRGV